MARRRVVVVGAGAHGLSTALHLAELRGSGDEIVVLDKGRIGAGASGISGGIVRNFYLSSALFERWTCSSSAAQTWFTRDSYPVVGFVRENVYEVLDSNHGFKMPALGKLAVVELEGHEQPSLDAFRMDRFAAGALHPESASPYPWT